MLFYVDRCFEPIVEVFKPQIPKHRMRNENETIERICLCSTIEGCLNAAHWGHDNLIYRGMNEVFRLYIFDERKIDKRNLITSDELWKKGLVPDAYLTGENWVINQVLIPQEIVYFSIGEFFDEICEPILDPLQYITYIETGECDSDIQYVTLLQDLEIIYLDNKNLKFGKEIALTDTLLNNLELLNDYCPKEVDFFVKEQEGSYIVFEFNKEVVLNYKHLQKYVA